MIDNYTGLDETQKELIDFRDRFLQLKDDVKGGTPTSKLKLTSVITREYSDYQHIQRMWKSAGFKGSARIKGMKINEDKAPKNSLLMIGGAFDLPPEPEIIFDPTSEEIRNHGSIIPLSTVGITLLGTTTDGRTGIIPASHAFSEFMEYNDPSYVSNIDKTGPLFCDECEFTTSEFFVAPVIIFEGQKISRQDVIQFMSYFQRGVHTQGPDEKQKAKEAQRQGLLTRLSKESTGKRDIVSYIYQSIAQDITDSKDLKNLSERITNLEKEWQKYRP